MITLRKAKAVSPLGHSANVDLRLHISGQTIPLAQTCSTALKLARDIAIPLGRARVEIITDGISNFSDVMICGREQPDSRWLKIQSLPADPAGPPE